MEKKKKKILLKKMSIWNSTDKKKNLLLTSNWDKKWELCGIKTKSDDYKFQYSYIKMILEAVSFKVANIT